MVHQHPIITKDFFLELFQDLKAVCGTDPEVELIKIMTEEINAGATLDDWVTAQWIKILLAQWSELLLTQD
jgi:hypothetical protein